MREITLLWLFLVAFATSTTGYATSPVEVVVSVVVVAIMKRALFLGAIVMTSAFIWKINLLRDLSLVALAKPAQSGEGGLLVMHVCLELWHPWHISHGYQDTIKQKQHLVRANPATSEMEKCTPTSKGGAQGDPHLKHTGSAQIYCHQLTGSVRQPLMCNW